MQRGVPSVREYEALTSFAELAHEPRVGHTYLRSSKGAPGHDECIGDHEIGLLVLQ